MAVDYRFAFTLEGFLDGEVKDSSKYVKYLVRARGTRDGVQYEKLLPYHKCTEEDWSQFPPSSKASGPIFEKIRDDPKRGFFCFDWDNMEDFMIYGKEIDDEY